MKKILFIILITLIFSGCKNKKTIEFCEGFSPEGAGMNCGEKFSTGEITVLIKSDASFGLSKINMNIYKKTKYKSEKIESIVLDVNPEELSAKTNLYFYDEGYFTVEVTGQDNKKIAEGSVSIVDVY